MNAALKKKLVSDYGDVFLDVGQLEESQGEIINVGLGLDIALSGGFQMGNICYISGKSGSGKTTLCLTICAAAQAIGKKCYFVDVENRLQPSMLSTIKGLDTSPDKFQIIKSTKGNLLSAENYLNILMTLIKSEEGIVVIIDSIASLASDDDLTTELGESKQMGKIPKLMSTFLNNMSQVVSNQKSLLIGLTHIQPSMSAYSGPTEVGGTKWQYLSSYRLMCLSSKEMPDTGEKTGRESTFKILKTALGPGTGEGVFYIKYGHGYNRELDLISIGRELGLISRAGSWYSFVSSKEENIKVQGENDLCKWLLDNPREADILEQQIRSLVLKPKNL